MVHVKVDGRQAVVKRLVYLLYLIVDYHERMPVHFDQVQVVGQSWKRREKEGVRDCLAGRSDHLHSSIFLST